ncbi:uncharacterized protein L199_004794 [Kwoniella botswanensis]|uniref:uncharacterized protein n=1 Tax=Kwoniella botswanensis TaxID=1268659 RepID=UPI00315CEB04
MDMDDDDAFLYGDESPPKPQQVALPPTTNVNTNEMKPEVTVPPPLQATTSTLTSTSIPANGISSSMAASLAAYGMDTSATVVDNPEDGGVEEEDNEDEDEDDDSDDSDDDIKVVFTGQNARTLDLRKPQTAPSNVIGIGKWAHTSTGTTAPAAATPTPAPGTPQVSTPSRPVQPTANQTTEYTPTSRPGVAQAQAQGQPSTAGPLINPPTSSTPSDPSITVQPPSSSADGISGVPPLNPGQPPSTLPPVSSSQFITKTKIDPSNPTGIIPLTGQSVFEIDMTQFENSGQPWRKPGATLSDYFNFGFDEFTYPRYLRYKSDMEKGRAALANLPPMAQLPPDIANLLHIPNQNIPFNAIAAAQQQQQQQAQQQQQQQQQMQLMANQIQQQMGMMNPQMQAQMQQMMAMQGLDMNMMNMNQGGGGGMPFGMGMQPQQGMGQQQPQQQQQQQQQPMIRPGQNGRPPGMTPTSQSGNMGTPEAGEEVKLEEGVETGFETPDAQAQGQMMNPAMRGRMPARGGPVRGVPLRGRGGGVPLGPRAGFAAPTGPKAGRFRDKDKVDTSGAGSLDYGGSEGLGGDSDAVKSETRGDDQGDSNSHSYSRSQSRSHSRAQSRDRSASPPSGRRRSSKRDYHDYDDDYSSEDRDRNRDKDREKRRSSRRSKNEDSNSGSSRSKRKREEGGGSATLGPGGWESEDEEDERRSRRKRSPSEESTEKRTRRSKRR